MILLNVVIDFLNKKYTFLIVILIYYEVAHVKKDTPKKQELPNLNTPG